MIIHIFISYLDCQNPIQQRNLTIKTNTPNTSRDLLLKDILAARSRSRPQEPVDPLPNSILGSFSSRSCSGKICDVNADNLNTEPVSKSIFGNNSNTNYNRNHSNTKIDS